MKMSEQAIQIVHLKFKILLFFIFLHLAHIIDT
jgi:hypothetical protein